MAKHCPKCERDLPEAAFSRREAAADGLQACCKECTKDLALETRYGKPAHELRELQDEGPCAICDDIGRRVIDHDHQTGDVRDGLCDRCNLGLGLFRDDPRLLRKAAEYVEGHDARQGYGYTLADVDDSDVDDGYGPLDRHP